MISSKKYVDQTLKQYHLSANKALGQNFLVNETIVKEICDKAKINEKTCVIEIGPGLGAMSEEILNRQAQLIAIEIDKNMVEILKTTFSSQKFTLIHEDFLKINLSELFLNLDKGKEITIISNLPYYITSQILNKLILSDFPFTQIIAMMQKEVGKKILHPQREDKNPMHHLLELEYEVELIKYVSKNDYLPRPEIDSVVLGFRKITPRYCVKNKENWILFLKQVYQNRRKTFYKNLTNYYQKEKIEEIFHFHNFNPLLRIDELTTMQIIQIFNMLNA